MIIGYSRVSTAEQNLHAQIDSLNEAGAGRIFSETVSGAKAKRPELEKLLDQLRDGDVVVVTSDSTKLTADQLYWDQVRNWVFTDHPNTIRFKNGAINEGKGFDSNQEFTNFRSRSNVGVQILEEDKQ